MKPHVEGPDFERNIEAGQILREARQDRDEIKCLRGALENLADAYQAWTDAENKNYSPEVWQERLHCVDIWHEAYENARKVLALTNDGSR
ncbi:MAG: hypothetical protein Q7S17_09970 [Xanthobacteraceae bacterium]|nr:hypothetical protein [Xanthobacteraceae bacterium]